MKQIKTQVGIIGAGPAGLTLAHWLKTHGIEAVILENRSREYAQSRVRAGLLEQNTVDIYKHLGLADRLVKEGQEHHGVYLNFDGKRIRVPFGKLNCLLSSFLSDSAAFLKSFNSKSDFHSYVTP